MVSTHEAFQLNFHQITKEIYTTFILSKPPNNIYMTHALTPNMGNVPKAHNDLPL